MTVSLSVCACVCVCVISAVPPHPTDPLAVPLESVEKTTNAEMGLTLASKFGFMLESCIVSARKFEPLVCPAHRDHPLPIRDIAPDLVGLHTANTLIYYIDISPFLRYLLIFPPTMF